MTSQGWGRVGTLIVVTLLVTSNFTGTITAQPQAVADQSHSAGLGQSAAGNTQAEDTVTVDTEEPPVVLKSQALLEAKRLDTSGKPKKKHKQNVVRPLNQTASYYLDSTRVTTESTFQQDAKAVNALKKYRKTEQRERAVHIAELIVVADNESAYQSIQDARQVFNQTNEAFPNQGTRRSTRAHIRNAQRAFDRAQSARERAQDKQPINARAKALRQLATAWRQSEKALETMSEHSEAEITITDRRDPIRNGSNTVRRPVRVNISAVQPGQIGNLTVAVNGTTRVSTPIQSREMAPVTNISATVPVNVSSRVATITVSTESSSANATLRLDGDGLQDQYEQSALGTDPLDPDSDSSVTSVDEGGDGVIDSREDYDQDRLSTAKERDLGTDPMVADTDGDGLSDGNETRLTQTDPLAVDTDDDGTPDSAEDPDGDSLTNAEELANGTDPLFADIDGDGLDDGAELANETNPYVADTDDDGLSDGDELSEPFNTDPLDNDTDDDGILDGNESYTTKQANESLGASISLTGQGNLAADTTIEKDRHARFSQESLRPESMVSEPVHVDVDGNMTNATVALTYNESAVATNESDLGVYRFNESTGVYERLPSTVDSADDTVRATTSHFSTVMVLDPNRAMETVRERLNASPSRSSRRGEVTFDFETDSPVTLSSGESVTVDGTTWRCRNKPRGSGSDDTPVKGECRFADGVAYVEEETNRERRLEHTRTLPETGQNGQLFVSADLTAHVEAPWSNAIVSMVIEDEDGNALDVFKLENDWSSDSKTVTATPRVNISEYAGENVTIAFKADGRWTYESEDTLTWLEVESLSLEYARDGKQDTDGDGISDGWEQAGIPLANTTKTVTLDPHDADTDGDGIPDGQEVNMSDFRAQQDTTINSESIFFPGFTWSTNPNSSDTDGDSLSDGIETKGWNIPVVNNSSVAKPVRFEQDCRRVATVNGNIFWKGSDCTPTDEQINVSSDPLQPDTDGDGLTDDVERNETYTDPSQSRTYHRSVEHQKFVDALGADQDGFATGTVFARQLHIISDGESLDDVRLTDATDDFDFVFNESGSTPRDKAIFTALDGTQRTDQWLNNREELNHDTDPWDPDTDDDGLTDGQEVYEITRGMWLVENTVIGSETQWIIEQDNSNTYHTDPLDPDTDDDGYWDGWIGVYDVGRTDNVVLYREHLQSGDGIEGDEIISEQNGVHEQWNRSAIPSSVTAATVDMDDDGTIERSNMQIGELQWGTDPTAKSDTVDLSIEVDFVEGVPNQRLNNSGWERGIEENYALYGIEIDLQRDESFGEPVEPSVPRSITLGTDQYMSVTTESMFPGTGFNAYATSESYTTIQLPRVGMYIYATPIANSPVLRGVDQAYLKQSPYNNRTQVVAAHVAMHEIGHSFGMGENDDKGAGLLPFDEIYSQSVNDPTPERLSPGSATSWSIMRSGWNSEAVHADNNTIYYAFSVEEAITANEP